MTYKDILYRAVSNKKGIESHSIEYNHYNVRYFTDRSNDIAMYNRYPSYDIVHFKSMNELYNYVDKIITSHIKHEDVRYSCDCFLEDYRDNKGYHFTSVYKRDSILANGLIASQTSNLSVLSASVYLDTHKTKNIPKDFYRSLSVYLAKEFTVDDLLDKQFDQDVYMVDISGLNWYIGSQSLASECFYYDDDCFHDYKIDKDKLKAAHKYWRNCYSKHDYMKQLSNSIESDFEYGLDEILIMYHIPVERVKFIGTFNGGRFHPNKNFKDAVRDMYKDSFTDILNKVYQVT